MRQVPAFSDPDSRTSISPETDPARWGHSLANAIEIVLPILEAAEPRQVAEVGAYAGDLTSRLLEWSKKDQVEITAIDPMPAPLLEELDATEDRLNLIRKPSHEALQEMDIPDAFVIDGDHNYYTVAGECRIIGERVKAEDRPLPLLVFHDVGWPHARRDTHYDPEAIPEEHRQELVEGGALFPGEPSVIDAGLPYRWPALMEGGPQNGVLTAIEDFVEATDNVRFALISVFFGVGIVWDTRAPYAETIEALVAPFDRNPVLERMEANRTYHLAMHYVKVVEAEEQRARAHRLQAFLEELSKSRAFATTDRIVSRGNSERSWRRQIRSLLDGF